MKRKRPLEIVIDKYTNMLKSDSDSDTDLDCDSPKTKRFRFTEKSEKTKESKETKEFMDAMNSMYFISSKDEDEEYLKRYSKEELDSYTELIKETVTHVKETTPDIFSIMKKEYSVEKRAELLALYNDYNTTPDFSDEKKFAQKRLLEAISNVSVKKNSFEDQIKELDTSDKNKMLLLEENSALSQISESSEMHEPRRRWIQNVLQIPFGKYSESRIDIFQAKQKIDQSVSFMEEIKEQIVHMIAAYSTNPSFGVKAIAMEGPPGVGKTKLARSVANALGKEFLSIPIGSLTSESSLSGDRKVYLGSDPGLILKGIVSCGKMDPVILLDEVDKISDSYAGRTINNTLIHLLDQTQNKAFKDSYFGNLEFDLSRAMFILTYNEKEKVDPILLDRLEKISIPALTNPQKAIVAKEHMIPELQKLIPYTLTDEALMHVIQRTNEKGCRQLYRNLSSIFSRVNMIESTNGSLYSYGLTDSEMKMIVQTQTVCEKTIAKLFTESKQESFTYMYT